MTAIPLPYATLYLIRHGGAEASSLGVSEGCIDPPLDADGEREARKLASCFKNEEFAYVLTSPRQAARRTCALAGAGRDDEIEEDLAGWEGANLLIFLPESYRIG